MARPERNTVDYFPFICDEGKKMFYIEETYGNDGFAVFVKILRELAKTSYHYLNLSDETTSMFLAAKCKVSIEKMNLIITDLVRLGKFDKRLWSDCHVIWCQDFVDSIQDAYSKRNNKCISYEGLGVLLQGLGVLKPSKLPLKAPVKPQSKVEYTKEKKSIGDSKPTLEEFLEYCKQQCKVSGRDYDALEYSLSTKYETFVDQGWKDGHGKPIKNWKLKIQNVLPHLREIRQPQGSRAEYSHIPKPWAYENDADYVFACKRKDTLPIPEDVAIKIEISDKAFKEFLEANKKYT